MFVKFTGKWVYALFLAPLLLSGTQADCTHELFSISSTKNTKIIDFIEQLSDECSFSIIATDPNVQKLLNTNLNKTNFNDLTIDEVLNIILKENNLSFKLENNILKISYLETKMFSIDYILSQRKSKGSTDITLSSEGAGLAQANTRLMMMRMQQMQGENTQPMGGGTAGKSGVKIESEDEVQFWNQLDLELQKILNRPQDIYVADAPIINKNAGIITVTATTKQMERFEKYLKNLQDKVQLQVLIDVQLLSVTMSEGKTTGVDWQQLYALQDISVSIAKIFHKNIGGFNDSKIDSLGAGGMAENSHLVKISANGNLNEIIKFLKTQGEVTSISNPKVLTLNNQAALITAGTEYFYKIKNTQTLAGGVSGAQSSQENILSIFAGVLLDITPEISDDKTITLKINPSVSETTNDIASIEATQRTMPPDLKRRQLSSVVTVKDGNRIILGGLINTSNTNNIIKVPILGDIPFLGSLFKYENRQKIVQELVIVIEPHIINKDKNNLSLSDLGYDGLSEKILTNARDAINVTLDKKKENK